MGEVYRALDTRLERHVAIKSLPAAFTNDPERRARFEREAKLLASLNHAHIAGIHGLEESDGALYLALEFVDGETLASRLGRGPLTVRETLEIGAQIASAIEAAHERGIIHRDLKPGNVMLATSRAAKVLDFGLAKGIGESSGPQLTTGPTMALSATGAGVILGTASYMSPEQARGLAVDRRTDIWAFGCILFECLAGRQAFQGETVSDVIARILEREPDWTAIPLTVPVRLRDLVRRCLTKDAGERPRDIGDLRRELSAIGVDLTTSSASHAASETPSLAVMYFENPANDTDSDYFCAGITEDILTDLSKIKGLRVASRNAVLRYRGAPVDVPKVAAELGVKAVLEGSVRRAGDRVRITVQLISSTDGFQLWAERYDRTLQDVFAVQEEIASSIAEALRVTLTPAETKNLVQDRPNDARAYDLYLKGRAEYAKITRDALERAMGLFREALAIDPNYALAWAGVADCYGQQIQWEYSENRDEAIRLGLEAARRAIAINPKLAEAHKSEALVLRATDDPAGVTAALKRAIEANPRYIPALVNLGIDDFTNGDIAACERLMRRSLEVDPQSLFALMWNCYVLQATRRFDEALQVVQTIRAQSSDSFYVTGAHMFRASNHLVRGDLAATRQVIREALVDGASAVNMKSVEALVLAREGRSDEARALVRELADAKGLALGGIVNTASAAVRTGDLDTARGLLGRGIVGEIGGMMVRLEPELHPLLEARPFAPRRIDRTLVWPLEAPMIDAARFALFREVKIESGLSPGSDVGLT